METFLIRALQLIMSLSLLVIIHEGGHFLFSRLFKVRVEKFYIFFDPWFSLFKFKPKNSDTEYRTDETTRTAVGVPFQTGMATFAYYDWRSVDELLVGYLYLFYDSIPLGGLLYLITGYDLWYEV